MEDKRYGFGIFRFPDGKTYEGNMPLLNHKSILYLFLSYALCHYNIHVHVFVLRYLCNVTTTGEWVKDKVHGGGVLRAPDGSIIED